MARASNELLYTVARRNDGAKLRDFVLESLGSKCTSSKEARKLIDCGAVYVNGKVERFGSRLLSTDDEVRVRLLIEPKKHERLQVLYEDEYLVVISKPAGCISSLDALSKRGNVVLPSWHLVHRLDKETSGVLLIAKTVPALHALEEQFFEREVEKMYVALVLGYPPKREDIITAPLSLKKQTGGQVICQVDPIHGMRAETAYSLRVSHRNSSLLQLFPKTGRTHQIRVHLLDLGCPVIGDKVYHTEGVPKERADRQLLHAYQLKFVHPITNREIIAKAPLPEDMKNAIRRLFPLKAEEVLCEFS